MKKLLTILTMVALLVPAAGLSAGAQTTERNSCPSSTPRAGYTDVDPNSPHAFDIDCIWWRGITDREGTFAPLENLPRWEMASWMTATVGQVQWYLIDRPITFTDTAALPADVQNDIEFIKLIGITKGTGVDTYDPYGAIPRWQMALFLTRLVEATGNALPAGTPYGFADIAGETAEAQLAINQLAELGITFGTSPTTFSPRDVVTREQMASFVARALEQVWVIWPVSTDCSGTAPAVCTGSSFEPSPVTTVPVRIAALGTGQGFTPQEWADFWHGPTVRFELYIDGVRQVLTQSVAVRPEVAYAFWETLLPAGTLGEVTFQTLIFLDDVLLEETNVTIEFY